MADKKAEIETKLAELQQWFKENSNLPEEIDPILLRRFLKCMNNDVEGAMKVIELNYSLRNKHPQIFLNRDPEDEEILRSFDIADIVPLPGLTPNKEKVVFSRLNDYDASRLNSVTDCAIYHMIADCRFTIPDLDDKATNGNEEDATDDNDDEYDDQLADGEIQVCDVEGYSMSHLARMSFSILRMHTRFLQEAYPMRLTGMHMINCPSFLNKMIAIVRPFIREEVFQMMHYHTEGLESLYEYVPRDMLPEEYGGKAGRVADLKAKFNEHIKAKREYLMDPKYWKIEKEEAPARGRWFWW